MMLDYALPTTIDRIAALLVVTCAGLSCTAPAAAQSVPPAAGSIYVCKDDHGKTLTSDRPIAECARKPMRELRQDGSLRREIAAPLTSEQIEQQRERQRAEAELAQIEAVRRRQAVARDRALLTTYGDEAALEAARLRQLAEVDADIGLAQQRLLALQPQLTAAQQEIARHERASPAQPLPLALRNRLNEPATQIAAEVAVIASRQIDRDRLNERFNDDLQRLRELLAGARASSDSPTRIR